MPATTGAVLIHSLFPGALRPLLCLCFVGDRVFVTNHLHDMERTVLTTMQKFHEFLRCTRSEHRALSATFMAQEDDNHLATAILQAPDGTIEVIDMTLETLEDWESFEADRGKDPDYEDMMF